MLLVEKLVRDSTHNGTVDWLRSSCSSSLMRVRRTYGAYVNMCHLGSHMEKNYALPDSHQIYLQIMSKKYHFEKKVCHCEKSMILEAF